MPESLSLSFEAVSLHERLEAMSAAGLDELAFGVIGFDAQEIVRRYNATESRLAGLQADRVLGHGLFTVIAPCMNNFLVAQRFQDAAAGGESLDLTIDYVLTLRMRPSKVKLRLLAAGGEQRYVVVQRQPT